MGKMTEDTAWQFVKAIIRMRRGDALDAEEVHTENSVEFHKANKTESTVMFHSNGEVTVIGETKTMVLSPSDVTKKFYTWIKTNG